MATPQERIEHLFEKGILVQKDLLNQELDETVLGRIETEGDLLVLNSDYASLITQPTALVDWYEIDKYRTLAEKDRDDELYQTHLQTLQRSHLVIESQTTPTEHYTESLETKLTGQTTETTFMNEFDDTEESIPSLAIVGTPLFLFETPPVVTILISYINKPKKYEIKDFTNFFLSRYKFLEGMLRNRRGLESATSISRILNKKEREAVAVIGLVEEIGETKNGNLIVTVEDPTGHIKVLINKSKKDLYKEAKDLVVDEVIGITGQHSENFLFAENFFWPDLPADHEIKKGETEEYAIFLSDIHVGSALFLQEEFAKFLAWINGQSGNEQQRTIAQNVKYVFIAGDLVDGVGIYPSQEDELALKDINQQYEEFTRLLKQIPSNKQIIMCPGNHDVVHLAEPQSVFYQQFAPGLYQLPNVTLVTNPSLVNIGKTETFSGFDVLLYHGYSFDYYVANVESIRRGGGYHRADLIMKFLLKRRHLAPSFKSTPYYPSHEEDPLLIRKVPDFLITGHIHYCCVANYKGVTMISGSCWQGKTTFQEKLGHRPEPARVPVVNLKKREVKVLRFG